MKKYLYYESSLEIWTDKDCHDYFERCSALEEQKSSFNTRMGFEGEIADLKEQFLE